jgi:hypothetical protein
VIALLPEDLRARSQSDREIVLALDDALAAAGLLEQQGFACAGWEGWVRDRDGGHFQHSGFPGHPGVRFEPGQDWTAHVGASWAQARETMQADQARWDSGWTWPGEKLFFRLQPAAKP